MDETDQTRGFRSLGNLRPSVSAVVLALALVPLSIQASISLTFQTASGGIALTGSGTNSADLYLGTVSKYGSISSAIARTTTSTDYTLTTPVGVNVTKSSESSTSYTLRARLVSTSSFGWKVNNVTMTTSFLTVATTQSYATTYSHTLAMVIADSQTSILTPSRDFEFQATAN